VAGERIEAEIRSRTHRGAPRESAGLSAMRTQVLRQVVHWLSLFRHRVILQPPMTASNGSLIQPS
jgi:hypothetical protein